MLDNTDLNSWDAFSGNFLKAEDVTSEQDEYVPVDVSAVKDDNTLRVRLHLERNGLKKDFDLNKTNLNKARELGFNSPKELIGTKITFRKVLARDPNKGVEVESLRIKSIEKVE